MIVAVVIVGGVYAQTDRLETYRNNFEAANIETKREILRAAESEDPAEFAPLYGQALQYVLNNAEDLDTSPVLREIASMVIDRIDQGEYRPAVGNLWRLFQVDSETTLRIPIIQVLSHIADDSPDVIDALGEWVATQNRLNQTTAQVDLQTLTAAVEALGELGASISFEPVLDVILLQYPKFVTDAARTSLYQLEGDRLELATEMLRGKSILERGPAFTFFMTEDFLDDDAKPLLAEQALQVALTTRPTDLQEQEAARRLRYNAAQVIREARYSGATAHVIRHFNETVLEFERGDTVKSNLLEAIATLGAMGNEESAQRLTDYLELLNTYTERDRPYDMQVVLATIQNLEVLDFPLSYNALFMTTILENYPDRVKEAAREASMSVSQ